jgi:hypothetical protein
MESRGIALLFFVDLGTLDGGGWSAPRPGRLYPGKDPVPIVQEAGWFSEPVWIGAENPLLPTGNRSPDLPARSESQYRLRHPDSSKIFIFSLFIYLFLFIYLRICLFSQVLPMVKNYWPALDLGDKRIVTELLCSFGPSVNLRDSTLFQKQTNRQPFSNGL